MCHTHFKLLSKDYNKVTQVKINLHYVSPLFLERVTQSQKKPFMSSKLGQNASVTIWLTK